MERNNDTFEGVNGDILGLYDRENINIEDGIRVGEEKLDDQKNPRVE